MKEDQQKSFCSITDRSFFFLKISLSLRYAVRRNSQFYRGSIYKSQTFRTYSQNIIVATMATTVEYVYCTISRVTRYEYTPRGRMVSARCHGLGHKGFLSMCLYEENISFPEGSGPSNLY